MRRWLALMMGVRAEQLDDFDRVQFAEVVRVCREVKSLSEAGRRLFSPSRLARRSTNDADRLSSRGAS